jgi:hypothetical protein
MLYHIKNSNNVRLQLQELHLLEQKWAILHLERLEEQGLKTEDED